MQLGLREFEGASLVVGHTDALPASMKEIIEISSVKTPRRKRRMGLASTLLSQICAEADRERVVMILQPGPKSWLQQFYGSHGFAVIQTEPVVLMARPPNLNAVMRQDSNDRKEHH